MQRRLKEVTVENLEKLERKLLPIIQNDPERAIKILENEGLVTIAKDIKENKKQLADHEFRCPVIKTAVHSPCKLKSCKFNVDNELANNCVLAYCHLKETQSLDYDEIAFLFGKSPKQVKASVENAVYLARTQALAADAVDNYDLKRSFRFIETNKICCYCGSLVDNETGKFQLAKTPLVFCSADCAANEKDMYLEWKFGVPVKDFLYWAFRKFRNIAYLERMSGVQRQYLGKLCIKYLGKELAHYYPEMREKEVQAHKSYVDLGNIPSIPPSSAKKRLFDLSDLYQSLNALVNSKSVISQ